MGFIHGFQKTVGLPLTGDEELENLTLQQLQTLKKDIVRMRANECRRPAKRPVPMTRRNSDLAEFRLPSSAPQILASKNIMIASILGNREARGYGGRDWALTVRRLVAADRPAAMGSLLPLVSQLLGLFEIHVRFGLLFYLSIGDATVVIRHGQLRVQANGLSQVGDGLVLVALLVVGPAPVAIRLGIFGSSRMASV